MDAQPAPNCTRRRVERHRKRSRRDWHQGSSMSRADPTQPAVDPALPQKLHTENCRLGLSNALDAPKTLKETLHLTSSSRRECPTRLSRYPSSLLSAAWANNQTHICTATGIALVSERPARSASPVHTSQYPSSRIGCDADVLLTNDGNENKNAKLVQCWRRRRPRTHDCEFDDIGVPSAICARMQHIFCRAADPVLSSAMQASQHSLPDR